MTLTKKEAIAMADIIVFIILGAAMVLALSSVIRDKKNGRRTCGYACGDEVCRGRCGYVNTGHLSRTERKEIKEAVRNLKAKQKAASRG